MLNYTNIYKRCLVDYLMTEDKITSITCKTSTIKRLREFEVHHRESNEEIILKIIKIVKEVGKK